MPELQEYMYCAEQICIPPAFPYLLRQYAKAAIRSQPTDLLRWSTAYFRCLSLGVPPPVKPRLEYPLPRDHLGLTPGWLRALLHQARGTHTIPYRVLWDRWIGACLDHSHLVQMLCLGGFNDVTAIPWWRFIALCAGWLSQDLTATMILICEILTEEPEGGSASIDVERFLDLYGFLARIDASHGQWLPNRYFTDAALDLYAEPVQETEEGSKKEESVEEESEVAPEIEEIKPEEKKVEEGSVISCPSVDGVELIEDYLKKIEVQSEGEEDGTQDRELDEAAKVVPDEVSLVSQMSEVSINDQDQKEEKEESDKNTENAYSGEDETKTEEDKSAKEEEDLKLNDSAEEIKIAADETAAEAEIVAADLESLKHLHEDIAGETDEELEKLKREMIGEEALRPSPSREETVTHYQTRMYGTEDETSEDGESQAPPVSEKQAVGGDTQEDLEKVEMIYVEAIPGIGGVVPEEMIEAVDRYVVEMGAEQHGLVMPRNLRHFRCPPLQPLIGS